ncbi:MAG TPA: hypothetical protein VF040_05060 [Ktedonobacterales bacterium]
MRPITYVLAAIGILLAMLGVVNHYLLNIAPVAHTSTILVGLGAVVFLVGLVTSFKDDRSTAE